MCPCLSMTRSMDTTITSFTVTVRVWWMCDFPVGSASFPPRVDGNLQALLQLDALILLLTLVKTCRHLRAEPKKPVQLRWAAAARAGHPNTAHVSDVYEPNWLQMMDGVLRRAWLLFFSGDIYLEQIKDLLWILTTEKRQELKLWV